MRRYRTQACRRGSRLPPAWARFQGQLARSAVELRLPVGTSHYHRLTGRILRPAISVQRRLAATLSQARTRHDRRRQAVHPLGQEADITPIQTDHARPRATSSTSSPPSCSWSKASGRVVSASERTPRGRADSAPDAESGAAPGSALDGRAAGGCRRPDCGCRARFPDGRQLGVRWSHVGRVCHAFSFFDGFNNSRRPVDLSPR